MPLPRISPAMYRRFALPYEQKVFSKVHNAGGIGRLHICGDTNRILPDMVASGAKIIDIDWMLNMSVAVNEFGDQFLLREYRSGCSFVTGKTKRNLTGNIN